MPKHDIAGVARGLNAKRFPERAELMKEFMASFDSPDMKLLLAEVGHHAVENNQTPIQLLSTGMLYGMLVGVLAEKYRDRHHHEQT